MKYYANLHTHSTHSDGKYTPAELARIAAKEGYKAAAVTDHDAATGYPEFKAECDKLGIECIFGVEFTGRSKTLKRADGRSENFHLTAYHFDPEYPPMKEYLAGMGLRETDQTRVLFERGLEEGLISGITWQEVLDYNKGVIWLCNEHVFRAMKSKGLVTDLDYPNFFRTIFGARRHQVPPAYPFKSAEEVIKLVHDAGGIIFVAHPHNQLQHIDALMELGIEGLEVWHPDLTEEEKEQAYKIGIEKGLYISGGSDHSGLCGGEYDNYEDPKSTHFWLEPCSVGTTKEFFDEIKNRKINR